MRRLFAKPENVARLLRHATEKGLPLNIQIEAFTLRFHSRFASKTNLETHHLVLESLSPEYGNELLSSNRFLSVQFSTGNFAVRFSAPFEKGWKEEGSWLWQIVFPSSAELMRQRRHIRVEPPAGKPVGVYGVVEDEAFLGAVVDISVGGALFTSKVLAPTLEAGKTIAHMQLRLPSRTIQVDARVVRTTALNCAVAFTAISDDDRAALREYVESRTAEIQRGFMP
ncbi:MAG TPA: PilZ domain-containing protein [bacterium]|nr:PilZ domain-containing protein [bacterium]